MMQIHDKQIKVCAFNQSYAAFQIPYAQNEGRLQYSSLLKWEDLDTVIDCSMRGRVFPQNPNRLSTVMGCRQEEKNQSEAAFHLNIFSSKQFKNKPVLFWIHGGGWLTGGGALPWYDGNHLAENEDIVVVTINYRIGALGAFQTEEGPKNLGLNDIINALTWVHNNIYYFGGDSDNITVGGQSAGAWYTAALLGHVDAHHLFNKAILASFPGQIKPLTALSSQQLSTQLQNYLAPKTMATATTQEILDAQNQVMTHLSHHQPSRIPTSFIPIESEQLSKDLIDQAVKVSGGNKDVMAWVTQNEMNAFKPHGNIADELDKMRVEEFEQPTKALLQQFEDKGSDVHFQIIDGGNDRLGAPHCFDLPLLFGNFEQWSNAPMLEGTKDQKLKAASRQLQQHVAQFMRA
ncbi:carboxylesterase family protein [Staphylococcus sp. MI 10-1553]|uniref:carboxylesterase family protein n=1 Tax=Staphylococcus sp. MI 10-1553 TaxID=1912064 RepID=UPI001EEF8406|nr:carboxylesterase family protein [Staphylococcus sp. MI 10-1553]